MKLVSARAGHRFEAGEREEIADLDLERASRFLPGQEDILVIDRRLGEIDLEIVGEAAGRFPSAPSTSRRARMFQPRFW